MRSKAALPRVRSVGKGIQGDHLLTTQQASWLLGLSPWALVEWRRPRSSGGPDFIRMGRRVRYSLQALRRYVQECTVQEKSAT